MATEDQTVARKFGDEAIVNRTTDTPPEVQSNHNTMTPATPVSSGFLKGRPDYNPMRDVPNRANDKSDVTLVKDTAKELIDAKGSRPTAAEVEYSGGKDMIGQDVAARPKGFEAPKSDSPSGDSENIKLGAGSTAAQPGEAGGEA